MCVCVCVGGCFKVCVSVCRFAGGDDTLTLVPVFSVCPPAVQMAMLLKLQESANYIESPERESTFDPSGHSLSLEPR